MEALSEDFGLVDSSPGIWKWPSAYGTVDGRSDIEVGVASFDRNFLVEGPGRQASDIRELLSVPANREALRDFFDLHGDTYVEDGFGYVVRSGMVADQDALRETVTGCLAFGENFGSGELPASTYGRIAGAMADSDTDDRTNDQPDTPQTDSKNDWWG